MDVRGIAQQKCAALTEVIRHAVMHTVSRKPVHPVDLQLQVLDRAGADVLELQGFGMLGAFVPHCADQPRATFAGQREEREEVGFVQVDVQLAIDRGTPAPRHRRRRKSADRFRRESPSRSSRAQASARRRSRRHRRLRRRPRSRPVDEGGRERRRPYPRSPGVRSDARPRRRARSAARSAAARAGPAGTLAGRRRASGPRRPSRTAGARPSGPSPTD